MRRLPILFFFFMTLVCAELLLQALNIPPKPPPQYPLIQPHPLYHHAHEPLAYYIQRIEVNGRIRERRMRFDREGFVNFRSRNHPKVLFLGDSMVEGKGTQVSRDEIFAHRLEVLVKNVDIKIAACSSWSSIIYYAWLKNNLKRFKKYKSVFLFYSPNDPYDTQIYLQASDHPEELENISFRQYYLNNHVPIPNWKEWLREHFKLYLGFFKLKNKIEDRLNPAIALPLEKQLPRIKTLENDQDFETLLSGAKTEQQKKALETDLILIVKIHQLLKENNIPFYLLYLPHPHQVSSEESQALAATFSPELLTSINESEFLPKTLSELAQQHDFRFIDLTTPLKRYKKKNPGQPLFHEDDIYLTSYGHFAIAEFLEDYLRPSF